MIHEANRGIRPGLRRVAVLALIGCAFTLALRPLLIAQKTEVTGKQALSVLQRCFQCHGESLKMAKLDLRTLDTMLKGGENGPAVVPGNAEASLLYKRVSGAQQPAMPMPPVAALNSQELALLKDWIDQGAKWSAPAASAAAPAAAPYGGAYKEPRISDQDRQWWAFQKPVRAPVPPVTDARWSRNPIDAFIRDMLDKKGLKPAPEADRRILIRRAYLDL